MIPKKILSCVILFILCLRPACAMDARMKALGAMALYGTVGGTLLGTASLAFGGEGRNVAKGASLGLYAGILFGTYVVASHAYRKHQRENPQARDNYYPDAQSPYEQGGGDGGDPNGGYRWEPVQELKMEALRQEESRFEWSLKRQKTPLRVFVPLLNYSF